MPDIVNTESGRRERKARETRTRVLDAAEALFVRDGYAATTIAAIAEAADVAVQTVYAIFTNKRTILTELLAARRTGDPEGIPLNQQADWQAVEQEPDPAKQVAMLAGFATRIGRRLGEVYVVLASASAADPDIAQLFEKQQASRYADQHQIAKSLAGKGALRAGLSVNHATDIMGVIANPRTYRTLVRERGWHEPVYQAWITDILTHSLLG
jgi:AcrR family transcriptional regulator